MSDIKIFDNPEFGKIRTIDRDGEPWMVGVDVAKALGYATPRNAIASHVDEEDKTSALIRGAGSNYKSMAILINESGLYSLVLYSKLPTAKKFKRWVTNEVLPSIRKTGGYIAGQESMSDSELMAKALLVAKRQIDAKTAQIEEMTPKAVFADAVAASKTSILIGELAKILRQNGVEDMGQQRLFEWMRNNGFLIRRKATDRNMPTQRAIEQGLMEVKETTICHSDGHTSISKTPKVTGKGQVYFVNRLAGKQISEAKE